jgi:hypothetical protein
MCLDSEYYNCDLFETVHLGVVGVEVQYLDMRQENARPIFVIQSSVVSTANRTTLE